MRAEAVGRHGAGQGRARPRALPATLAGMILALVLGLPAPTRGQPPPPGSGAATPAPAAAIAGTVEPGSVGNEVTVTVRNRDAEAPIQQVDLQVASQPGWLTNVRIDPEARGPLAAGASRGFRVRFDVVETARPGTSGVLSLRVVADRGLKLDNANPRLSLTVGAGGPPPKVAEGQPPRDPGGGTAGEPRLHLVDIQWVEPNVARWRVHHQDGAPGWMAREVSSSSGEQVRSVGFTAFPDVIRLGERFAITLDAVRQVKATIECRKSGQVISLSDQYSWSIRLGIDSNYGRLDVKPRYEASVSARKPSGPRHECSRSDARARRPFSYTDTRRARASLEFVLTGQQTMGAKHTYTYRINATGENLWPIGVDGKTLQIFWHADPRPSSSGLTVVIMEMGTVRLQYGVVPRDGAARAGAQRYRHPDGLIDAGVAAGGAAPDGGGAGAGGGAVAARPPDEPPRTGSGGAAGVAPRDPRAGPERPGGASPRVGPPSKPGEGTPPGAAPGPRAGQTGTPGEADIAPLVREWLAVAEPPINARGGRARYDEWGRVVGQVPGGVITAGPMPDDVGARTPIQYVWDKRDQLDSLRHCTLGTYVTRRLAGQPTGDCARAGGSRPGEAFAPGGLVGRPLREAVGLVAAAGLDARPQAGPPAPTPGLEGTIASARQEGKDVVLEVYTAAAVPAGRVPSVVGQRLAEAKVALEAVGLTVDPVLEEAAPSAGEAGRVHRQHPAPPAEVPRGTAVRVWVYGQPEAPVRTGAVCDLAGSWTNRANVTTTWTFTAAAPGSTTYFAEERGGCGARGTATLTGHTVRLPWSCKTRFAGTYQWELDAACESGTGSVIHTGEALTGRRFPSTISRVGPGPAAGDGARAGASAGRVTDPIGTPRESASAGPGPGSDAGRRLGPESLRFPATLEGAELSVRHPATRPGQVDRSGLVARPTRGWLVTPADGTHAQMVFYGAQFAPISLSVTWHPDPGEQCTRPAFDVVDRMVRDPSGRERPSSSYLMSLHPQGLAARAGLGAFGLTLEELRRRVPERQAATILAALLQQVAPYAHACR